VGSVATRFDQSRTAVERLLHLAGGDTASGDVDLRFEGPQDLTEHTPERTTP
jgi:hypothetical protein